MIIEILCYNLTLWKQDKKYQTGERMHDIQSDLDGYQKYKSNLESKGYKI